MNALFSTLVMTHCSATQPLHYDLFPDGFDVISLFFILFLCSAVLQSLALCLRFSGVQYACERWTRSCDVHLFFCSPVSTQWKDNMAYGVCQKEEWEVWGKRQAPVELRHSRINSLFSENIFASVSLCFVPSVLVLVFEFTHQSQDHSTVYGFTIGHFLLLYIMKI